MRRFFSGTGYDSTLWPVLLLLLIVLVPSAGVVWMMRAAMENERLAVRQRLVEAYHAQLDFAKRRIDSRYNERIDRLNAIVNNHPPARAFADCVHEALADSVVILGGDGRVAYPAAANVAADAPVDGTWNRAQRLEFIGNDPAAAAQL